MKLVIAFWRFVYNHMLPASQRTWVLRNIFGVQIGERCLVGTVAENFGSEPYLVRIGNHVGIATGVIFITHGLTWSYRDRSDWSDEYNRFGRIIIGDNCNIGINAMIMPGVTIGESAMIGAGSVITKDVPARSIVGGNPAKILTDYDSYWEKLKTGSIPDVHYNSAKSKAKLIAYFWGDDYHPKSS